MTAAIIGTFIALLAAAVGPCPAADRLVALGDSYLTHEAAPEHLLAAAAAAAVTGEGARELLAVAWHETRFTSNYVQAEPPDPQDPRARPRWSCGVMTPEPHAWRCTDATLFEQYLDGATHLAVWRGKLGRWALLGYAGGRGLYNLCAAGARRRECNYPDVIGYIERRL